MTRYYALPLTTKFWRPGTNYLNAILEAVGKNIRDGDFVVVSEKALSTAIGNVLDEARFEPGFSARIIARYWMRWGWGYPLGISCRFGKRLLQRLRKYPIKSGSRHKQAALQQGGLMQALMFGSEAGIDGSNLPYSLVSLPLPNAYAVAEKIRRHIRQQLGKKVTVIIVDTDKTYTIRNFHFTPRPKPLKGISSRGSLAAYVIAKLFKLRKRPTPLAVAGYTLSAEHALVIANVADRARGPGSGATVWDMAARFKVNATGVSWEMLEAIKHKPIVLVRHAAYM
jgi:F420-0:gamma-glutamyl ligase-like protein